MLEFKDATISIGGKVLAKNLSFIAKSGQLTCVTGAEGSGKTTLVRMLMGFLPVSAGFVSIDGELLTVSSAPAFRRMMVYLPQQMQMLRHQLMPPEPPSCEADDFGLWHPLLPNAVETVQPAVLSPEEIFQLAEQTLREAPDKSIVIADEPVAQLTPELAAQMLQLLRTQAAAGKTVLIVSRRQLLVDYADLVINLDRYL